MYVCMYVSMYLCMYVCMYICMYVCIYACMYVCIYVCMYICMYECVYVCMYVCIYVCMSVYIMHVCIMHSQKHAMNTYSHVSSPPHYHHIPTFWRFTSPVPLMVSLKASSLSITIRTISVTVVTPPLIPLRVPIVTVLIIPMKRTSCR